MLRVSASGTNISPLSFQPRPVRSLVHIPAVLYSRTVQEGLDILQNPLIHFLAENQMSESIPLPCVCVFGKPLEPGGS